MANVNSGNTWYIDSVGSLVSTGISSNPSTKLYCLILTPTAANGRIVLSDPVNGYVKMDFRAAVSGESNVLDLTMYPATFPNGVEVTTLTNAVATLIVAAGGK